MKRIIAAIIMLTATLIAAPAAAQPPDTVDTSTTTLYAEVWRGPPTNCEYGTWGRCVSSYCVRHTYKPWAPYSMNALGRQTIYIHGPFPWWQNGWTCYYGTTYVSPVFW